MTKTERNRLIKTLDSIERTKTKIAEMRDKLRHQVNDLDDILESMDEGAEHFEYATRLFRDGLDNLSKYL